MHDSYDQLTQSHQISHDAYLSGTKVSLVYIVEWVKTLVTMASDRTQRVRMAKTEFAYFLASY